MPDVPSQAPAEAPPPSLREATGVWAQIGLLSFGGPAGQIALMHRMVVEERRWIPENRFLHALNFCMLLPGPEAQQLATYIGWLLHGWRGGVVAGTLFVLPGLAVMLCLSTLYLLLHRTDWLAGPLIGLKAAVLAIVVSALARVAGRSIRTVPAACIGLAAFAGLFVLKVPFPIVILAAGAVGALLPAGGAVAGAASADPAAARSAGWRQAVATTLVWLGIWGAPVAAAALLAGPGDMLTTLGLYFSRMAVITFGGAYAVLAWVAQEAVDLRHWLSPAEMIDGLALAETTPGPLILVLTHVGYLAAARDPGALPPVAAGLLGALMTAWVTFVPSFLWIFLGAPHVERLRSNRRLAGALAAITAAVVGVMANLALWFALHVLFAEVGSISAGPVSIAAPRLASLQVAPLVLAIAVWVALTRLKAPLPLVLAGAALAGFAVTRIGA